MHRYWLMKSEPEKYGWDALLRDGETVWDGVRNHRASNNMRAMQVGDQAFFYHSVTGKEIVGIVEISRTGLIDPTDPEGKWATVMVKPVRALERPVTLAEIKGDAALEGIELVRLSRLSVAEITPSEWEHILALAAR
ncbi:EVE domain-containing protein [Altererythrobacter lauratis]|uniref:EVE domain-containing protein n=1 Tax=Alteraurantiacibacter lauratis TaxID=2054627 RepID=A0ABV7EEW1_9SPHN